MRPVWARTLDMITSGSFMSSPEPVGSRCQGCEAPGSEPGVPLTSAAHRLLTNKNDPEVIMPRSLHPRAVPGP
jgi:hypothetical protein